MMLLTDVLRIADELCPNPYTEDEKWNWIEELSAMLRQEVKKLYEYVSCTPHGDALYLPQDVEMEQVAAVWGDGFRLDKEDFHSDRAGGRVRLWRKDGRSLRGQTIRLAFLSTPLPVRRFVLDGNYDTKPHLLEFRAPEPAVGDTLEITAVFGQDGAPDWDAAQTCHVMKLDGQGTHLAEDNLTEGKGVHLAARRVITDTVEVPAPYQGMYIEYLLAKMTLYQRDQEGYINHMAQFNTLLDGYTRWYKQRAPVNGGAVFHRYWP